MPVLYGWWDLRPRAPGALAPTGTATATDGPLASTARDNGLGNPAAHLLEGESA